MGAGVGFTLGMLGVLGPAGIVVVKAAGADEGTNIDGIDGVRVVSWGAMDVDVIGAVLGRDKLLLGTVDGTDDAVLFCAVTVVDEDVAGVVC